MLKKVVIPADRSNKAVAFFEEINRRKEASKAKFSASTARIREILIKNAGAQ